MRRCHIPKVGAVHGRHFSARNGGVTPRALEFAILTAARSGEVRGATWAELDLKHADGARWTVPAARMKAGQGTHRAAV